MRIARSTPLRSISNSSCSMRPRESGSGTVVSYGHVVQAWQWLSMIMVLLPCGDRRDGGQLRLREWRQRRRLDGVLDLGDVLHARDHGVDLGTLEAEPDGGSRQRPTLA